ncbi:TetR/AcrR family transcriptional regulator [Paenibacillus antri]|uniref:TetR/AcrR family transcriptional regulator n=1 Tax=Paenibacillus antri TaxID=2582848 RepID=A0A5R9GH69_9BACL|nr:TetR/AcrR family transcriptional regulator [Paenibacillus antri]TLS52113.1 TetR/AcrR family transcriptional regulator [Paenibacillus antri]
MARRIVEQELSRERILDAARELFVSEGYRSVSMRKIAGKLGYSHGSIYYYFQDKAELFYALVVEDFNALIARQTSLLFRLQQRDVHALKQLMLEFVRFGLDNPHHYEIMFLIRDPELKRYSRTEQAENMNLFASIIQECLNGHPDREKLQFTLPWNLFMALHGLITYAIQFELTYDEVLPLATQHVDLLCSAFELGGLSYAKPGLHFVPKRRVSV